MKQSKKVSGPVTEPLSIQLGKENLAQYFLLPLSSTAWTESPTIRPTLIDLEDLGLWVGRYHLLAGQPDERLVDGMYYRYHDVDTQFLSDFLLFLEGKYSHMSKVAKDLIIERSGLAYNVHRNDGTGLMFTDAKLLGLTRHGKLHRDLEEELDITIPDGQELLPMPKDEWFMPVHG